MARGKVREPAAYLAGVMRNLPAETSTHRGAEEPPPRLTPAAEDKLRRKGLLTGPHALDDTCLDSLAQEPPEMQYLVCDTFIGKRLDFIRSIPGGLVRGICSERAT